MRAQHPVSQFMRAISTSIIPSTAAASSVLWAPTRVESHELVGRAHARAGLITEIRHVPDGEPIALARLCSRAWRPRLGTYTYIHTYTHTLHTSTYSPFLTDMLCDLGTGRMAGWSVHRTGPNQSAAARWLLQPANRCPSIYSTYNRETSWSHAYSWHHGEMVQAR